MTIRGTGTRVSGWEQGSYFGCGLLNVWIELERPSAEPSSDRVGVRWSVDAWRTFQDTEGRRTRRNETFELWRVEVAEVAAVGWRDGSIGGPNGEQPSSGVWLLWGRNREQLRALPRGSSAPAFEYAVFVRHGETTRWDNNEGENFRIGLGALPEIERARGSLNDFPKSQREE